jgi:Kdo2-lipid IVA lauroyltransferase/acyltransferase
MLELLEFLPVWFLLRLLRVLPRGAARRVGMAIGLGFFHFYPRLRCVGLRNLELAFPEMPKQKRLTILRGVFLSLGRLLAEFPKFPNYSKENVSQIAVYDGLENFETAHEKGKGVLMLTAHLGGWEVGSFVHSIHGHTHQVVVRDLDNRYLNRLVRRYRTLHGNGSIDKSKFARGLVGALRRGGTVGILMDTNMTPPQGEFVDFFGHLACTAVGIARVAQRTGAAVVPAFTIWDDALQKYRIHFEPELQTIRTGDDEADAVANTAIYTKVIESFVRRYPDQWLWVHRRWKTRPPGEPPIY